MRDVNVKTGLLNIARAPRLVETKELTENGTYKAVLTDQAEGYKEVVVNVPEPAPVILESLTATENGTYDPADYMADGFSDVTVNVQGSVSKPLSFKINTYGGSFNNTGTWVYQSRYVQNFSGNEPYYPLRNDGGWPSYNETLPLKIHLRFKCKNPYTVSHTMAILGHTYDFYYGPAIEIRTDGSIWCGFSTNGGAWQYGLSFDADASRASKFQSDWNTIDYEYGGSGNKVWTVTYTDPNGVTEVRTTNVSDDPYLYTGYGSTCLGGVNHSSGHNAQDAILDLFDCYWKQNGTIIWGYEL